MSAEFMVICKKILFRNCVIVSLFVFTYNTWAQCNNNIKIMRKYESEGTIHSDQIAGGVFIIEIGKNDGRILNFGHGK
ncbi:hypothetical protein NOY50_003308 [Escherichia coli]|nr:hypothetical protein [Escherichia coli]EJN0069942.1 hypothetical protein [Escherichia coli]EJN0108413.1 hypothetical protein [Escherichia coli]